MTAPEIRIPRPMAARTARSALHHTASALSAQRMANYLRSVIDPTRAQSDRLTACGSPDTPDVCVFQASVLAGLLRMLDDTPRPHS